MLSNPFSVLIVAGYTKSGINDYPALPVFSKTLFSAILAELSVYDFFFHFQLFLYGVPLGEFNGTVGA